MADGLRRTALTRRAEMRRTPMPRRKRELRARKVATSSGRRDTGPSPRARRLVEERAGYCCEVCGVSLHDGTHWVAAYSIHHRRPRGNNESHQRFHVVENIC